MLSNAKHPLLFSFPSRAGPCLRRTDASAFGTNVAVHRCSPPPIKNKKAPASARENFGFLFSFFGKGVFYIWFGCLYGASYTEPSPIFLVWLSLASLTGFLYVALGLIAATGKTLPPIRPILGESSATAGVQGSAGGDGNGGGNNSGRTGNPIMRAFGKKKGGLPPGWVAVQDPKSGQTYYVHKKTNKTQWEKPTE